MRERGCYCSRQIELHVHTSSPCPQDPWAWLVAGERMLSQELTLVLGQEFWNWETPSYTEATGKHAQPLLEKVVIFIILVKKKKKSPFFSRGRYTISFVLDRHFLKASPREKKKKAVTHTVTPYHEELSPDKIDIGENGTFLWIPHIYKSNSLALYTPNDKKPSCL